MKISNLVPKTRKYRIIKFLPSDFTRNERQGKEEGELSTAHSIAFCPDDDIVIGHLDGRVQRFSKKQ